MVGKGEGTSRRRRRDIEGRRDKIGGGERGREGRREMAGGREEEWLEKEEEKQEVGLKERGSRGKMTRGKKRKEGKEKKNGGEEEEAQRWLVKEEKV